MKGIVKAFVCVSIIFNSQLPVFNSLHAQTPREEYEAWKKQAIGNYGRFRQQQIDEYQNFRKKANEEYAEFVKSAWEAIGRKPAIPVPEEPKPPVPPVAPEEKPQPQPIPHEEVVPIPTPQPVPEVPMPTPEPVPIDNTMKVIYYGTTLTMHMPLEKPIVLKDTEGETLGKAWKTLSDGSYDALLADCLKAKKTLGIGDWGYITLLGTVAKSVADGGNEAVLLQEWLLAQSGYKARLARTKLGVLQIYMPFDVLVFNLTFIELEDEPYFLITDNGQEEDEIQVVTSGFPGEHLSSLRVAGSPKLEYEACGQRTLRSKEYPPVALQTEVNRNLIAYYNDYPKVAGAWDVYATASLSDGVKKLMYPKLRTMLQGKSELEKTEMLLNWVQTAFEYKTDEEQFGGERSLFADESLYYPYCDCEDRSILLSILVRDLLGLDVVLLHFPGHLATAVKFTTNVEGDYLVLEDGKYIVCDPTYIGAPVGLAMPEYKGKDVKIEVFELH